MDEPKDTRAHPDAREDASEIQQYLAQFAQELLPVLEHLASEIEAVKQGHEGFIGSLREGYRQNGIKGLKDRHGARLEGVLGKLGEAHKHLGGKESADDFWSALHDKMQEIGVGPENEDAFMDHVHGHLSKTHEALMGALGGASPAAEAGDTGAGEAEGAPAAEVKVTAAGEPEAVEKGVEKAAEEVKKVSKEEPKKESEPAVGSAEYFKKAREGRKTTPKARK